MADPWAQFSSTPPQVQQGLVIDMTPTARPGVSEAATAGGADPWAAFATAPPKASETAASPTSAGVMDAINNAANWFGTQATKAATGFAGTGRGIADTQRAVLEGIGLSPEAAKAANYLNPITAAGQFMPSAQELNRGIFQGGVAPEQNMPGPLGPAVDAGTQAAISTLAMPGSILRNLLPAFAGGSAQEIAGNIPGVKGTKFETLARMLTGAVVGGATAAGQNVGGNVLQGVRNIAPNVEDTAAKLIGRAAIQDKTTIPELVARQQQLGPGAPLVEAGGQNIRGVLRGAIGPRGEARTNAQEFFDARKGQVSDLAQSAVDKALGTNPSMATTVEDIAKARSRAAAPQYRAAGIPDRIIGAENPTSPVPPYAPENVRMSTLRDKNGNLIPLRLAENMPQPITDAAGKPLEPLPAVSSKSFNTPTIDSPAVNALLRDSVDVQAAIKAARKLPDFKDLPDNSMAMLDKAYKHLGDLEQGAKDQFGRPTTRSRDVGNVRQDLKAALIEANPQYGAALDAFSGPSKIIAAAQKGKDWLKGAGMDPAVVKRQFSAMSPDEQQAAREIGLRDVMREAMDRKDTGMPGGAIWSSPRKRAILQAVLKPEEFAALEKNLGAVKNAYTTATDINVGSRTAPMLAEIGDNKAQSDLTSLGYLLTGHPIRAIGRAGGALLGRVAEGKTEAVNAKIADYLTATDPAKVGLVQSLAEKARQAELARQLGRRGAAQAGVLASALTAGGR